jgi:hypothetical protein
LTHLSESLTTLVKISPKLLESLVLTKTLMETTLYSPFDLVASLTNNHVGKFTSLENMDTMKEPINSLLILKGPKSLQETIGSLSRFLQCQLSL